MEPILRLEQKKLTAQCGEFGAFQNTQPFHCRYKHAAIDILRTQIRGSQQQAIAS